MENRSTTLGNHNTTQHNQNITLRSITTYLSTMPREDINLDTKVEDEVNEDLEEAGNQ
jgi:hypothetical protein